MEYLKSNWIKKNPIREKRIRLGKKESDYGLKNLDDLADLVDLVDL